MSSDRENCLGIFMQCYHYGFWSVSTSSLTSDSIFPGVCELFPTIFRGSAWGQSTWTIPSGFNKKHLSIPKNDHPVESRTFRSNLSDTNPYVLAFGGSTDDSVKGAAVNKITQDVCITGSSSSSNFPKVLSTQAGTPLATDAFLTVFNSSGVPSSSTSKISALFGGTNSDVASGIDCYADVAYVTGYSTSTWFNATTSSESSIKVFVSFYNISSGAQLYNTIFGIGSHAYSISYFQVGQQKLVAVVGGTTNSTFPVTSNAYQKVLGGSTDGFLMIMNVNTSNYAQTTVTYRSFFGGNDFDDLYYVATDSNGYIYAVGDTASSNLNCKGQYNGSNDALLAIFSFNGTLMHCRYFGAEAYDTAVSVDVQVLPDGTTLVLLGGGTTSSNLVLVAPFQNSNTNASGYSGDLMLTAYKVATDYKDGNITFNTYLGTSSNDYVRSVQLLSNGRIVLSGGTAGSLFPGSTAINPSSDYQAFITVMDCPALVAVTPSPSPTPSVTPSISSSPSTSPTASITPSTTPSVTPTPSATASVTPSKTPTASVTPTTSVTPSVTPSATPSSPLRTSDKKSNTALIGAVSGSIALLLLVTIAIVVAVFLKKRKPSNQNQIQSSESPSNQDMQMDNYLPLGSRASDYAPILHTPIPSIRIERDKEQDWSIPYSDLVIDKEIGRGAFGVVYKGKWRGVEVAANADPDSTAVKELLGEARLMTKLRPHPHITQILGVCEDPLCLVTEFVHNGSLLNALQSHVQLDPVNIARDIAAGMFHLHGEGVIHRDLAARNILLDKSWSAQVSDFGMSRIAVGSEAQFTTSNVGPIRWMAPEALRLRVYDQKTDVWSYGVVLYEIVTREVPYGQRDPIHVATEVMMCELSLLPEIEARKNEFPSILVTLMRLCLQVKPEDRPTFAQIVKLYDNQM